MFKIDKTSAYLITKKEHVFYLTNFKGSGFVIVRNNSILLATDQRYWGYAKQVPARGGSAFGGKKKGVKLFEISEGWEDKLNKELKVIKNIYFEEYHLTISSLSKWKKILPKKKWKQSKDCVNKMRLIKNEDELNALKKAANLGDIVLKKVLPSLKAGVTEKEISNLFKRYSDELANGVSFKPVIAFGVNAAIPHHKAGSRELKKNDVILIDQGVNYNGYMSDMTRCFFVGKGLLQVKDMYDKLLAVQKTGVNMVRPGVNIQDLSKAVRALLGPDEKYFTHSLGHGIGLEIHESPAVSIKSDEVLKAGMVITIEPGLYKTGVGGVRIEDTVIVTEDGSEVITKSSKSPLLK